MASYTVAADEVGVQNKTLAVNTVDTVTFSADLDAVVVFSDGAGALFFTVDGSTPTVGGSKTHLLPAGVRSVRRVTVPTSGNTAVKLISAAATSYSVESSADDEGVDLDTVWSTRDQSPPLVQIAAGGMDVDAGEAVEALPATAGRIKALISFVADSGVTGVLWVRFDGGDADAGVGEPVYPGSQWSEFTASAVSVFYEGTGSCRIGTSELGT